MTGEPVGKVLLDVDTGVDDAMAIALAVASPEIELAGVTTVAGNVTLDLATANTLRVLDFLGAGSIRVYRGMSRPLVRAHFDAAHFHGEDGLGGAPIDASRRTTESTTAPEFIVQAVRANPGALTLVFVGPLTNLAVSLALEPELPQLVARTVIMGGAFDVPGNATPFAEFNIAVDPEAARIVAESELNATWVGLDVTHSANLNRADWDRIGDDAGAAAVLTREVCRQSFHQRGHESVHLHDPLAVGVAIDPAIVHCRQSAVWVDTSVQETAGATRIMTDSHASEHLVALGVSSEAFREMFGRRLGIPIVDARV